MLAVQAPPSVAGSVGIAIKAKAVKSGLGGGCVAFALAAILVLGCEASQQPAENTSPAFSSSSPATQPAANCLPVSFGDLARAADPGVVYIETEQDSVVEEARGMGTGFFFEPGLVLTNHHVIRGAKSIQVAVGERQLPARVVGVDAPTDVAVLQVDGEAFHVLPLGSSKEVAVGDWVVAIGNPFGLAHTVSAGIVSAKGRTRNDVDLDPAGYYSFLQTDASINPGNSGGPLLDLQGNVVGINTAIRTGASGIGFAIPIDMVRALIPRLLQEGKVRRSALGVVVDTLSLAEAKRHGVKGRSGAVVLEVAPGGPADEAGLRAGDILFSFNGETIEGRESLRWLASMGGVGSTALIELQRGSRIFELRVRLGELSY